ncbi:MAG: ABC transporter ATP-binding protein [Bacteroidota bacterium]
MSLELQNVSFAYPGQQPVLRDISFSLNEGECVLILGRNGAGKSTLLKLLNGILRPGSGSILLHGESTSTKSTAQLARHIAVTFQNPADQIFASSVREEIMFGPRNLKRDNALELVEESLTTFGLTSNADDHPYDLLPARRKLLTVASAVASDSPLLVFDEPSAGLSHPERLLLHNCLSRLIGQKRSILVVSHDLDLFLPFASRILVVDGGTIVFQGGRNEFLSAGVALRRFGVRLPMLSRIKKMLNEGRGRVLPLGEDSAS